MPRADISKEVEKSFKKITNNDWKTAKEGIDELEALLTANSNRISPNGLIDLVGILKNKLAVSNKSLSRGFIAYVGKLADAMGSSFKNYFKTLLTPLANNLSDK